VECIAGGTSMPSARSGSRLMTSSNLVACSTRRVLRRRQIDARSN
jgi:hypothetical protein